MTPREYLRGWRRALRTNYHALDAGEKRLYNRLLRPWVPRRHRFFFEGLRELPGQMWREERRALHSEVRRRVPRHAYEIGTFFGGGSTYFTADALASIGRGQLCTLETDAQLHARAVAFYREHLPRLAPFVAFCHGRTPEVFLPTLQADDGADFVFLDGAEDGAESVAQYQFFAPWFRPGSLLALHDWNTEKMSQLRGRLEADPRWCPVVALDGPFSIGFRVFARS